MKLILASTSPRRREVLALLGLPFEAIAPGFDEVPSSDRLIEEEVLEFAAGKAASVAEDNPGSIIIGSDTMILIDGKKIGKPDGIADARQMLRALSGKVHRIFTSVAIVDGSGGPGLRMTRKICTDVRGILCRRRGRGFLQP